MVSTLSTTPGTWPSFLDAPPPLVQRFSLGQQRLFREVTIPLHRDDAFRRWWKANGSTMIRAGWGVTEFNGLQRLNQWLQPDGSLTPTSIEKVRRLDERLQMSLPLEEAPLTLEPLPDGLEEKLFGYQVVPARQLWRALTHGEKEWGYSGAVDLSDMGTGKTYQSLAAALATGKSVIVLCPVVGRGGWERAFQHFGAEPHYIGTYEGIRSGNRPAIVEQLMDGSFRWKNAKDIIIIMDEAQAVRHDDSLTFRCCAAAITQKIPIIIASATVAINPIEMRFAGRIVGLHRGGDDWTRFLVQHGCSRAFAGGNWKWDGQSHHLAKIHSRLFPHRGCRVRKEDLGSECPETEITVLPIKCKESAQIEAEWKQTQYLLDQMAQQGKYTEAIARRMRMRTWQRAEMALVPHVAARAKADVAAGRSVAIFVSFTKTREELGRLLKTQAGFYGGQNIQRRKYWEAEFQANREHVLISNIGAGGASVSLHDLTGERPRSSYIFPNDDVVKMEQSTGRIDRVGGKSKSFQFIPCVAGTLSEKIVNRTRRKLLNIATLNDGVDAKSRI